MMSFVVFVSKQTVEIDLEFDSPTTYFGNCIVPCFATAKRSELVGQNGLIVAAKAIANCVKQLETTNGAIRAMEKSIIADEEQSGFLQLAVLGFPKYDVCKNDFGWGFPKKVDTLRLDSPNAITMVEYCREEEGGIEFTLELKKEEMNAFVMLYYKGLRGSLL